MRRYLFISLLALWSLCGCNDVSVVRPHTSEQDSVLYTNFMMNLIVNNYKYLVADYPSEAMLLHSDQAYYLYKATKVLHHYFKKDSLNGFLGYREVKDTGLTMRIHRWTCGCEISLPNTVIYLSDRKDFEYAFILKDESHLRKDDDTSTTAPSPDGPSPLEFQLNFLINKLKINNARERKPAEHFLSLIADSLLQLKKISIKDTAELRAEEKAYTESGGGSPCSEAINRTINSMIAELKAGYTDVLFYHSSSKYYKGFWRFQFTTNTGRTYIKADFNKCICGKLYSVEKA